MTMLVINGSAVIRLDGTAIVELENRTGVGFQWQ